ncbi:serine protease [Streptomyces sp. C10-9-1]|uniref:serine protease n=1 Tax=Streptomyces sp. C10-9-1 TaxID=1859285 RepID=UPI0021115557|nr:serine protease [Streptomyces sp. C10-9-1]MCQ6556158.1 serine protease [Streptomyces sp. C10-9-1]
MCLAGGLQAAPAGAIVGGREAGSQEHPHMVGLYHIPSGQMYCGATLIAARYVLTAAHCVQGQYGRTQDIIALVGDHDYATGRDTNTADIHPVAAIKVHEHYAPYTSDHNIAILRLTKDVEMNYGVQPAKLPWLYEDGTFDDTRLMAFGWGTLSFNGPAPTTLQTVNLDTMTNAECTARGVRHLTPNQMCTHTPGKGTCQFDGGGPLTYLDGRGRTLVGIISHGSGCATEVPDIHTRVSRYLDWILKNTPGATYTT